MSARPGSVCSTGSGVATVGFAARVGPQSAGEPPSSIPLKQRQQRRRRVLAALTPKVLRTARCAGALSTGREISDAVVGPTCSTALQRQCQKRDERMHMS